MPHASTPPPHGRPIPVAPAWRRGAARAVTLGRSTARLVVARLVVARMWVARLVVARMWVARMWVARLVAACLATTGLLTAAPAVQAHATLVKSEPARRGVLATAPRQVRLWFNERLEPAYSTIRLAREGTGPLTLPAARVDPQDARLLVLDLPALEPGTYTVQYRVLSVDGHTVDYGYTFTVKRTTAKP